MVTLIEVNPLVVERVFDVFEPGLEVGEVEVEALLAVALEADKDQPHQHWQVHCPRLVQLAVVPQVPFNISVSLLFFHFKSMKSCNQWQS